MTMTARDAILRELETAEAGLSGANDSYASAEAALHAAQRQAERSYENRAKNVANVARLKKALRVIEGKEA